MATKQFSSRIINKHDTEANWNLTNGFVPFAGETIVYDPDANHPTARIKIGDGSTDVKLLPFAGGSVTSVNSKTGAVTLSASDVDADPSGSASTVQGNLDTHTGNTTIHVTSQNKTDWNAKYDKPSGGIPKTDLASDVQTSLGKADTALQSAPVTSVNTKTGAVSLTASDVGALPSNTAIHNVPSGGAQGQVLTKSSSTDYDAIWANVPAGTEVIGYYIPEPEADYVCNHTFAQISTIINSNTPFITCIIDNLGGKYVQLLLTDMYPENLNPSRIEFGCDAWTVTHYQNNEITIQAVTSGNVTSVNGQTGTVVLTASDVGADPAGSSGTVASTLTQHVGDTNVHTTSAEKAEWDAKYDKPSGGIPKTDLASGVQASLDLADTALQSAPVTSVNTKTGTVVLNANDVGAIPTTEKGANSGVATLSASGKVPSSQLETRRDFTFTCTAQSGVDENTVIGTLAITDAQIKDCFDKGIRIHGVGNIYFTIHVVQSDWTVVGEIVSLDDIIFTPYLYVDTNEDERWHLVSTPFCTNDSSTSHLFIFVAEYDDNSSTYNVTIKSYRGIDGRDGRDGADGPSGPPGEQGPSGYSPYITVDAHEGYHTVTVHNEAGSTSFDVHDGTSGGGSSSVFGIDLDLSFDITGITYNGQSINFASFLFMIALGDGNDLPKLFIMNDASGMAFYLENAMAATQDNELIGKIIFRCNSVNKSGLIDAINSLVPDKFPSNTTDLDIVWTREYDSDNDTYVEALAWSPITGGVTTIDMSGTSAQTFAAALGGFIQAASSTPNVPTSYIYTGGTIDEYQDVMDALNAGKTVWLNNNGLEQSIVNYSSSGFTVHVYLPQYDIGQGVNIIASVDIFVTNSLMIMYGYFQMA